MSRYPSRQIEILMKGRAYDELKYQHTQLQSQLTTALAKNAELEQQVKESQEQEPVIYVREDILAKFPLRCAAQIETTIYNRSHNYCVPLYAAPVISEKKEEGK